MKLGEIGVTYLFSAKGAVNLAKARLINLQKQADDGTLSTLAFRFLDLFCNISIKSGTIS